MNDNDGFAGLRELHKALDDALEVLAAFLSAAASGEPTHEKLIEAGHKTCDDLGAWRATLRELVMRDENQHGVQ